MSVNSRSKGARFERYIANDLRRWLGVRCDVCRGSGCDVCNGKGYTSDWTVSRNRTDQQAGQDGQSAGEFSINGPFTFPFVIECKHHKAFNLAQLFRSPVSGPFEGWWMQAIEQARAVNYAGGATPGNRFPLLVIKQSMYPTIAVMRRGTSIALSPTTSHLHCMELEVFGDTVDVETLRVWRWSDLMALDSLCLRELT